MSELRITTNRRAYKLVAPFEVPHVWKRDFDYIDEEEAYSPRLVKYRGCWYDVNDTITTRASAWGPELEEFAGWDSYIGDSYFSGVLFAYVPDTDFEEVYCGTYTS